jgi:molybdopterin synthase catalytic subunit
MAPRRHTGLTTDPLGVDAAHGFCADPAAGAVVVFTGVVRDHSDGRSVTGLSYEAYEERAGGQLDALATRVAERWPMTSAVWLEHRLGDLAVGEVAVVVAVSSPHRGDAFDAARWAMDTLKSETAIWKQEHWADGGTHWPGSPG